MWQLPWYLRLFWSALSVFFLAEAVSPYSDGSSYRDTWPLRAGMFVAASAGLYAAQRVSLTVDVDRVVVTGPLRRCTLRLAEIHSVTLNRWGLWIECRDATDAMSSVAQKGLGAQWLGANTRADVIARSVLTAAARFQHEPLPEFPTGRPARGPFPTVGAPPPTAPPLPHSWEV